jgi:hypothetical protein
MPEPRSFQSKTAASCRGSVGWGEEVAMSETQRQDSLTAQIDTVIGLANDAGCYDAADWIRNRFWESLAPANQVAAVSVGGGGEEK